jgi:hypothetical protein
VRLPVNPRHFLHAGLVAVLALAAGCRPTIDPQEQPVSFWADPKNPLATDPCIHATAQAILKSGLPYPNYTTEEVVRADGTKSTLVKTVDVWVGPTRYVLPAKLVSDNGMYGRTHPSRFWKLEGSLPNFYPPGPHGPEIDRMGSMVQVSIMCSVDPAYMATYGKGYRSNEEGIAKVKARYQKDLEAHPAYPGTVTVSIREDLKMTEVLKDRAREANGQRSWEASYWPLESQMVSFDGDVSRIGCTTRHDPVERRYGGIGWRCSSSLGLSPHATAKIEIYVAQIAHMPAIYEQVKQMFADALRE